ncbi:signal peptidase I [Kitasatospora sp. NPDC092948]|uniref:signal peptidase I n=1 Tax=Kitasatospora sp. NPDC092948 TaxID=3364088 RepID=UPI003827A68D
MTEQVEQRAGRPWRRIVLATLGALLVTALVAAVAAAALAVRVDGHSMEPTLVNGQRLLAVPGTAGRAERLDVVLLRTPGRDTTMVKRVIGLPGDRVEILARPDDPFVVLVQPGGSGQWYRVDLPTGRDQDRHASPCCAADGRKQSVAAAQLVPPGKLFFLGDNSDHSDDARSFGWGDLASVTGRVGWSVLPLSRIGALSYRAEMTPVAAPEEN